MGSKVIFSSSIGYERAGTPEHISPILCPTAPLSASIPLPCLLDAVLGFLESVLSSSDGARGWLSRAPVLPALVLSVLGDHCISEPQVLAGRDGMNIPRAQGGRKATPSASSPSFLGKSMLGPTDQLPPGASQPSRWCEAGLGGACQPAMLPSAIWDVLFPKFPALPLLPLSLHHPACFPFFLSFFPSSSWLPSPFPSPCSLCHSLFFILF